MGDSPMGSGISEEDKSNNGDKDVSRVNSPKMGAGEFWSTKLKAAKFVVAPMVDQSELAWRMLSRKYGAQLCFTPMLHASVFIRNRAYQIEALLSCPEDRPLIVQFCANDPDTLLTAAKIAQGHCDAIDINLGCPQKIAKKGHYGAFLQDEWDLLHRMVNLCHTNLKVPITCKIRVFESLERTVQYAQMLERAGCQLLTVHGRTREQKGPFTGTANWDYIQAVRENVKIPVFANGNIQYLEDVERCLKQTGVNGIMSAEGNLHNPALFKGLNLPVWQMAVEYLEMVEKYPCSPSYIRGHLFKLFHHAVQVHQDIREEVARAKTVECFKIATQHLKEKCQVDVEQYAKDPDSFKTDLPHPYWICQPYVRPGPQDSAKVKEEGTNEKEMLKKRPLEELKIDEIGLSKNKLKKKMRNPTKNFDMNWKTKYEMCEHCPNPKGKKCVYGMCKNCCRMKTYTETLDCASHNFSFKTRHKQ